VRWSTTDALPKNHIRIPSMMSSRARPQLLRPNRGTLRLYTSIQVESAKHAGRIIKRRSAQDDTSCSSEGLPRRILAHAQQLRYTSELKDEIWLSRTICPCVYQWRQSHGICLHWLSETSCPQSRAGTPDRRGEGPQMHPPTDNQKSKSNPRLDLIPH